MSNIYLSYDGDSCGKKVGRAIMANDEVALREISAKIDLGHEIVRHWVAEHGGKVISGGGDEGSFKVPEEAKDAVEQLRKDHHYATGITISVGIGNSLSEAGRALLAAKFRGKDQIACYDESVEKDIASARKRVKKGKGSQEEVKLAEAYLEKAEGNKMPADKTAEKSPTQDCQYCEQTDQIDPQHCKYCHDADAAEGQDDCPYCKETADAKGTQDCPYCKDNGADADACPYCTDDPTSGQKMPEMDSMDDHARKQIDQADGNAVQQQPTIVSPDSGNETAPPGSAAEKEQANRMGMNPPMPSPDPNGAQGPGSTQTQVQEPVINAPDAENIAAENAHSKDAMQAIVGAIENQTTEGQPNKEQVGQIDDTDLANVSPHTQENVSRPAGYEENTPADMGLGEEGGGDEPDLNSVLQEGLDNHAQNMQKEKVVQMASQALEAFKGSKAVLEKAKELSPQLYQASILMLKAMIEMAKLMGLGEEGAEGSEGPIGPQGDKIIGQAQEGQAPKEDDEWKEVFPKHPDQGGENKPGHAASKGAAAEAPKDRKTIGQPIGKLSSKHTTKHIARTTMPPGAVNAKGQQKVTDPKTGKTRWIDRKQGMVQSPTGVPIKSPKQGGGENDEPKNKDRHS